MACVAAGKDAPEASKEAAQAPATADDQGAKPAVAQPAAEAPAGAEDTRDTHDEGVIKETPPERLEDVLPNLVDLGNDVDEDGEGGNADQGGPKLSVAIDLGVEGDDNPLAQAAAQGDAGACAVSAAADKGEDVAPTLHAIVAATGECPADVDADLAIGAEAPSHFADVSKDLAGGGGKGQPAEVDASKGVQSNADSQSAGYDPKTGYNEGGLDGMAPEQGVNQDKEGMPGSGDAGQQQGPELTV